MEKIRKQIFLHFNESPLSKKNKVLPEEVCHIYISSITISPIRSLIPDDLITRYEKIFNPFFKALILLESKMSESTKSKLAFYCS